MLQKCGMNDCIKRKPKPNISVKQDEKLQKFAAHIVPKLTIVYCTLENVKGIELILGVLSTIKQAISKGLNKLLSKTNNFKECKD